MTDKDVATVTDEEYRQLQEELAARTKLNPTCDHCQSKSYGEAWQEAEAANFFGSYDAHLLAQGWRSLDHAAGYFKYCSDCAAKPTENFGWIKNIPFDKFKQWQIDHPHAYVLNDMTVLLPAQQDFFFVDLAKNTGTELTVPPGFKFEEFPSKMKQLESCKRTGWTVQEGSCKECSFFWQNIPAQTEYQLKATPYHNATISSKSEKKGFEFL